MQGFYLSILRMLNKGNATLLCVSVTNKSAAAPGRARTHVRRNNSVYHRALRTPSKNVLNFVYNTTRTGYL